MQDAGALDENGKPTTAHLDIHAIREIYRQERAWGEYLTRKTGERPPPDMPDPHADHILMKEGIGPVQKALVLEGQALLRRYGIDPIYGVENLTWAPRYAKEQHTTATLRATVEALKSVESRNGTRADIVNVLARFGKAASARR